MGPDLAYDLVVFDLDGVLVDTSACHAWAFNQLWRLCGIDGPAYGDGVAGRTTLDVVLEHTAHLQPSEGQVTEWVAFKQARVLECFERRDIDFPDVLPVLRALREGGVDMAVATGASRARTTVILERLGVDTWFRSIVTADDVRAGKPDPETYAAAIERARAEPSRTGVVEDSPSGVESALAAGAHVASVRTGIHSDHPRFLFALRNLHELTDALGVRSA
jgi:HAD superfamily hydrolase (TIGR01509 family)